MRERSDTATFLAGDPDAAVVVPLRPLNGVTEPDDEGRRHWLGALSLSDHATERIQLLRRQIGEAEERIRDLKAALDDERRHTQQRLAEADSTLQLAEDRARAAQSAIDDVDEATRGAIVGLRAADERAQNAAARQQQGEAWLRRIHRAMEAGWTDRVAEELGEPQDGAEAGGASRRSQRASGATASGAQ